MIQTQSGCQRSGGSVAFTYHYEVDLFLTREYFCVCFVVPFNERFENHLKYIHTVQYNTAVLSLNP